MGRGLTKSAAVLGVAGVGAGLTVLPNQANLSAGRLLSADAASTLTTSGASGVRAASLTATTPGAADVSASKSTVERSAAGKAVATTAISAPTKSGPGAVSAGSLAFTAVAKPKPKVEETAEADGVASDGAAGGVASPTDVATATLFPPRTSAVSGSGLSGLTGNASALMNAVTGRFGQITNVIGVRPDSIPDHPSGRAVDFMIPNWGSSSGAALGTSVAAYVEANANAWNVDYIIYRQRIWFPGSGWRSMSDRGSPTANHYDHVHVSVR